MTLSTPSPHEITQLLIDWNNGSQDALDQLYPLVYEELRRLAHRYMIGERPGHTLQTTAVVHEAYLRLVDVDKPQNWKSGSGNSRPNVPGNRPRSKSSVARND